MGEDTAPRARPEVSLVVPVYDEEAVLPELGKRLAALVAEIGASTEVLFVDDGSTDRSSEILTGLLAEHPAFAALTFSRNFGHQAAITAGIDHARGEAVIVMDADLQDPPDVCLRMIEKWREGFDVVYARRGKRAGETIFKRATARVFYRVFSWMIPIDVPLDTGDFRLMSRRVVLALRGLRESHRFVRAMVAWLGFRQTAVVYERPERFAGETKYPLRKMLAFAVDGITSFSILPLRLSTYLGLGTAVFSFGVGAWAVYAKFVLHRVVEGWTATIVFIALFAGVQLLVTGILGEYVGRLYEEVKRRPLYVVKERVRAGDD
jgi:dolichol-phosphate mannosyltransferase